MPRKKRRKTSVRSGRKRKRFLRLSRKLRNKIRFFTVTSFLVFLAVVMLYPLYRDSLEKAGLTQPSRISREKVKEMDPHKPKLTFVIDDIGYHRKHEKELIALGDNVTYAILPMLPYSRHFGHLSQKTGAEVILHLPLEALDGIIPGRGLITRSMDEKQVLEVLRRDLASAPNHVGINNHMGSLGTTDPVLMGTILGECKKRNLFFLDSYTTQRGVIRSVGQSLGVPILKRDVFLDNIDAEKAILNQLKQLKSVARKKGYAVGIGHYRHKTLSVLRGEIPKLRREGYQIISLSDVSQMTE